MKKLFPLAFIAILCVLALSMSCQKNRVSNEIHYCYCGYIDSHGEDSAFGAYSGYSAAVSYENAKKMCQKWEDSAKATKPSITCYLE